MAAAGRIIGRKECPWCGFEHAHVRKNEGRNPYHYCPSCGYNVASRNGHQADLLLKGMRPERGGHAQDAPVPAESADDIRIKPADPPKPVEAPAAAPAEPAVERRAGPFDVLLSSLKR